MGAASARAELGDVAGAVAALKEIAADLSARGRGAAAVDALTQAERLQPDDEETGRRLATLRVANGDLAGAREWASTGARRAHLGEVLLARGDTTSAAEYLSAADVGDDPRMLVALAEARLRSGSAEGIAEGQAFARRLCDQGADGQSEVVRLGCAVAPEAPAAGYALVELVVDSAVAEGRFDAAGGTLEEFAAQAPRHIPALMRLVEVCVDGGLDGSLSAAQERLADAYLAAGQALEARFIAEDLLARQPGDAAAVERLRRALQAAGESDPEAIIAQHLAGPESLEGIELFPVLDIAVADQFQQGSGTLSPVAPAEAGNRAAVAEAPPPPAAGAPDASRGANRFDLTAEAIDLRSVLQEVDPPPAAGARTGAAVEVDLSDDVEELRQPPAASGSPPIQADNIEGVFAHLRDEASRHSALEEAQAQLRRGMALRDAGDMDGAVEAFQTAARAPSLRFVAASTLGRLFLERGLARLAVEWLERGAEAPAPTSDEAHALLYELAAALEAENEVARALAVCLELQAEAGGGYRNLADRVARLSERLARG